MFYSAIIPCGGSGTRLNLGYNKLLYQIGDKFLIEKTLENFLDDDRCKEIILCIKSEDYEIIKSHLNYPKIKIASGGKCREESVFNGLKIAKEEYVLIHDGARFNVTRKVIDNVLEGLTKASAVIPVVASKDASLIDGKYHFKTVSLIQTPQGCKKSLLLEAMENANLEMFKDDISIISFYHKIDPFLVDGDYSNIKVTTKEDLSFLKE